MSDLSRQASQFLLFRSESGEVKLEVLVRDETVWLTQSALAELFGVQRPAITKHLRNVFAGGELVEESVRSILEHTANDGKNYKTSFYNLDAIISVGYRINSLRATQFRTWATTVLGEYIVKGFVLDDDRLKQGTRVFGNDYFRELLGRDVDMAEVEDRIEENFHGVFDIPRTK